MKFTLEIPISANLTNDDIANIIADIAKGYADRHTKPKVTKRLKTQVVYLDDDSITVRYGVE